MRKILFINLLFTATQLFAQSAKDTLAIYPYSVQNGTNFISLQFFSLGRTPFQKIEVMRTDGKKLISLGISTKRSSRKDTTLYLFTDTTAKPNTLYQYAAAPMKADGSKGNPSKAFFASTKMFASYYFTKADAKAYSRSTGIELHWALSSIDNIKAVQLYKSENSDEGFALLATLPSTDSIYVDMDVEPDKIYYYHMKALNFITNDVVESATVFESAMPVQKPLAPLIQNVVQTERGVEVKVQVKEKHLAGVALYRKAEGSADFKQVTSLQKCDSVVVIIDSTKGQAAKTNYVYTAKAENVSRMESDFSNEVTVHHEGDASEITTPLEAMYDDRLVKLFWDNPMNGFFRISRSEKASKEIIWLNGNEALSGSRYVDTAILPGRIYEYVLYPMSEDETKGMGSMVTVETFVEELTPNNTLRGFALKEGVMLEWGAVADSRIQKQELYRYQPDKPLVKVATLELNKGNYLDKTAVKGQLYRYFLVSVDGIGNYSRAGEEISLRFE